MLRREAEARRRLMEVVERFGRRVPLALREP